MLRAPCRRAGIGGHDQDGVAEIDRLAVVVGELAVVHDLQQDVEQVGMRLLDLVEQQHRMRVLVDRVGQQAALVVADIARGRADQPADRVALHIFGHVEPLQRDAHDRGELARDLGLADAGRAREQVIADRLVGIAQAGAADSLIAEASFSIAISWPNTTRFKSVSSVSSTLLVVGRNRLGGMRAMVATTASISLVVMIFLRRDGGTSICIAPTSSITSIALSGSLRS